jgi:hypothetical protein
MAMEVMSSSFEQLDPGLVRHNTRQAMTKVDNG